MAELREVVFLDAVRTPIGRIRGALKDVRPDDLLAGALRALLERTRVPGSDLDEVVAGCANQAGEDNRNVARMALLLAGVPNTVPGVTVNRLCASSLTAVNQAARQIACGDAELIVACGVESMTRAPLVVEKGDDGFAGGNRTMFDTSLGWRFPNPKMQELFPLEAMGETAENLVEQMGITRDEQDELAFFSHQKALAAEAEHRFDAERISIAVPQKRGEPVIVRQDEGPRPDTSIEQLSRLRPAFRKNGSVTAGNSSTLNDGAAAILLGSKKAAEKFGLKPLAKWVGGKAAGVDPRIMGIGPVPAVESLLDRFALRLEDLDLLEINEAFAAQVLGVLRRLKASPEVMKRVNVNGGAIALGHPLGASGARILTTLLHEMRRARARRGLATMCVGVGQGVATLVEAV